MRLHLSDDLSIDERREANGDRIYPKDRDVLFYAAVGDDVLVSQRLRQRSQTIHCDGHGDQDAHAAECDHNAIWHDAKSGNAVFRQTRELQLHPDWHKYTNLPTKTGIVRLFK